MAKTHHADTDARAERDRQTAAADAAGRWMVAVWYLDQDSRVQLRRTTWNFPKDDLRVAATLLSDSVQEELDGRPVQAPPLPLAGGLPAAGSVQAQDDPPLQGVTFPARPATSPALQAALEQAKQLAGMSFEEAAELFDKGEGS